MKEYEKLAEEYEDHLKNFTHPAYQGFLAGFEVAREMAFKLWEDEDITRESLSMLGEKDVSTSQD